MRKVVGEVTANDGTVARLVQHGRDVFSLTITSRQIGRNRWGTRAQIDADIAIFKERGTLPLGGRG